MSKEQNQPTREKVFYEVATMLQAVIPKASPLQQNEHDNWPKYNKYAPQLLSLLKNSQWPNPPIYPDFEFAKMLSNLGTYLWHTGQYDDCDTAMNAAEHIIETGSEEEKSSADWEKYLSDIQLVTGIVADCVGVTRREESLDRRRKLSELRQREFNRIPRSLVTTEDEIRLGNAKGDLACAYLQRGLYKDAREIMEKLLKDYQRWGTEKEYPYEYAKYYNYVAIILMADGQPKKSLEYGQKGLNLEEAHAHGVDSTVLTTKYGLACLYFNSGDLSTSLKMHEDILKKRIEIHGQSCQLTLESYEAIGIIHHQLGNYPEAKANFENCLDYRYQTNWNEEGITRARYWYSCVLWALGQDDKADEERNAAMSKINGFKEKYSEFIIEDPENEAAVFDQILPIWIMQTSGKLQDGGRGRKGKE
ncbi:hypothetical protein MauCBS54593_003096 [Microsporum audouinii]